MKKYKNILLFKLKEMNKEIVSGMIGGSIQVIATQPLNNMMNAKQAGMNISFNWRGIVPATITNGTTIAVVFYTESNVREYVPNVYMSSAIVGGLNSIVTCPFENIRIRKLLNRNSHPLRLVSSFRGLGAYFPRETIAWSCYIGSYNSLRERNIHPLISGGFAGWFSWFTTYPIDVIKTRIQGSKMTYKQAFKKGRLWEGFGYCSVRAILGNAICFYTYETIKEKF